MSDLSSGLRALYSTRRVYGTSIDHHTVWAVFADEERLAVIEQAAEEIERRPPERDPLDDPASYLLARVAEVIGMTAGDPPEIVSAVQWLLEDRDALRAERDAMLKGREWVSVDAGLPEKNTEVLIAFREVTIPATGQYTSHLYDHHGWSYPRENCGLCDDGSDPVVTHWMPLPDAPQLTDEEAACCGLLSEIAGDQEGGAA